MSSKSKATSFGCTRKYSYVAYKVALAHSDEVRARQQNEQCDKLACPKLSKRNADTLRSQPKQGNAFFRNVQQRDEAHATWLSV